MLPVKPKPNAARLTGGRGPWKFQPPLHHFLVTACYVDHNGQLELQTSSLEASVSQRLLVQAAHRNFTF
jgi:hypothetical protein